MAVKTQIYTEYEPELEGLKTKAVYWHNADVTNFTKYNNWNFTNNLIWDGAPESFWYHPDRTYLAETSY